MNINVLTHTIKCILISLNPTKSVFSLTVEEPPRKGP